jgi:hypothetical protein
MVDLGRLGRATVAALSYAAVHPVTGKAASAAVWVFGVAFTGAFAAVGALLAWKRPQWASSRLWRRAAAPRLKDAVDLDTIRDDLISVVQMAMEPADLSTWTTHHD